MCRVARWHFFKQKIPISEGHAMEDVGVFYGHLVYFKAIGYILWPFGIFYAYIFVIFFRSGMLYQENSGNPADVFVTTALFGYVIKLDFLFVSNSKSSIGGCLIQKLVM
jgi:hypothetical protein